MNSQLSVVKDTMQNVKIVEYLTPNEVKRVVIASNEGRHGSRGSILVKTLFETGLRTSKALSLTAWMIVNYEGHAVLFITGKGNKPRMVACPNDLANEIRSHAYLNKIDLDQRIWDINRKRAWQIIKESAKKGCILKRVYPHLFRRSTQSNGCGRPIIQKYYYITLDTTNINDNEISSDTYSRRRIKDTTVG